MEIHSRSYYCACVSLGFGIGVIIMTNGDKIRSMSDMELSRELCKITGVCSECLVQDMCDKGHTGFEQWLKEEVNEDE